jgi:hypothetical protein
MNSILVDKPTGSRTRWSTKTRIILLALGSLNFLSMGFWQLGILYPPSHLLNYGWLILLIGVLGVCFWIGCALIWVEGAFQPRASLWYMVISGLVITVDVLRFTQVNTQIHSLAYPAQPVLRGLFMSVPQTKTVIIPAMIALLLPYIISRKAPITRRITAALIVLCIVVLYIIGSYYAPASVSYYSN